MLGQQSLTRLKYNYHKPKIQMKAGSGIDWFDLEMKISFGDQEVSLLQVRKAVLNKQKAGRRHHRHSS